MLMLGPTVRAVYDIEHFLDLDTAPSAREPTIEHPDDRIRILRDFCDRMERLMPRAMALSAGIPPNVVQQARQFLRLADGITRQHIG